MPGPLFPHRIPRSLEGEGSACSGALLGGWDKRRWARLGLGQESPQPGLCWALSHLIAAHAPPNPWPLLSRSGLAQGCQALPRLGGQAQLTGAL